jgi:hydroxymethylbilane synthase
LVLAKNFDAIVLAEAGINRLGIELKHFSVLPGEIMLPAVGQGTLAVEVCAAETELAQRLGQLNHVPTQTCIERKEH